ncbi:MAG: hypothetical protein GY862_02940 [Gammaproteobacteria bacterium]|nr:hypothetical protein [Gammaproteobacteria bacterium]
MSLLFPEELIVERLKTEVPGFADVFPSEGVADAIKSTLRTPAAHVIYMGYQPVQNVDQGKKQEIETYWLIVVAVRNVRTRKTGEAGRKEADPLISAVFDALLGHCLDPMLTPLKLEPAPHADFSAEFGYFPLKFSTRIIVKGKTKT